MADWLTKELAEATYLYCYRRLSDTEGARDLAQEILAQAYAAWKKGLRPVSFFGWYWQLAHNQYCLFCRRAKGLPVSLESGGGSVVSAVDDPADLLLAKEAIAGQYYALSRITGQHREMLRLFYLSGLKISEIAKALSIPEGTVKRRLFDARQNAHKIQKGVDSMQTHGLSAFAPASLSISGGYRIVKYDEKLKDRIVEQIFIAAASKPVMPREIADEIGVAPVYFEEKLAWLLENRFLKEAPGGKILTEFCVMPMVVKAEWQAASDEVFAPLAQELAEALSVREDKIRALPFYGNHFPFSYLLWFFLAHILQAFSEEILRRFRARWEGKVPNGNGKDYRLNGWVIRPDDPPLPAPKRGFVHWSNLCTQFQTADFRHIEHANLFQAEPFPDRDQILTDRNVDTFMKLWENPSLNMTPVQKDHAAFFLSKGYLFEQDGKLFSALPVWKRSVFQNGLFPILREAAALSAEKYAKPAARLADELLLPYVRPDLLEEYINWLALNLFFPAPRVMYDALYENKALGNRNGSPLEERMADNSAAGIYILV